MSETKSKAEYADVLGHQANYGGLGGGESLEETAALYALAVRVVKIVESDSFAEEVFLGGRGTATHDYGRIFRCQVFIPKAELTTPHGSDALAREKCRGLLDELKAVARPAFLAAWPHHRFRKCQGPRATRDGYCLTFEWVDPEEAP